MIMHNKVRKNAISKDDTIVTEPKRNNRSQRKPHYYYYDSGLLITFCTNEKATDNTPLLALFNFY